MASERKEKRERRLTRWVSMLLAAALALLLTGCARRCSFCGRRTLFFDQFHLYGVELTVCRDCQQW